MKTVTGEILSSSTPIPVSRAAKIIANFTAAADNGASRAVSAYLRRASDSFNELKQLHGELRRSSSKKSKFETTTVEGGGETIVDLRKKHKKRKNEEESVTNGVGDGGKKKRRKSRDFEQTNE